jgi:hypothetical protein
MRAVFIATFAIACSSSNGTTPDAAPPDAAIDVGVDGEVDCASCGPATGATFCVAGTVVDSVTNQPVSQMRVRIYEALELATDLSAPPVAMVFSDATGSFADQNLSRSHFGIGVLVLIVDGNGYMQLMQSVQLPANQNVCVTVAVHH